MRYINTRLLLLLLLLLPPDKTLSHMLRARGHAFQLLTCTYNLHKKSCH